MECKLSLALNTCIKNLNSSVNSYCTCTNADILNCALEYMTRYIVCEYIITNKNILYNDYKYISNRVYEISLV